MADPKLITGNPVWHNEVRGPGNGQNADEVTFSEQCAQDLQDNIAYLKALIAALPGPDLSTPAGSRQAVLLATAGALAAYTRVGNVITFNANGQLADIDLETPTANIRILLRDVDCQAGADAGIYVVTTLGTAGTPAVLTRAGDFNTSAKASPGVKFMVLKGATHGGKLGVLMQPTANVVLNTSTLVFELFDLCNDCAGGPEDPALGVDRLGVFRASRSILIGELPAYTLDGNTLTGDAVGAIGSHDGASPVAGDLVQLLKQDGTADPALGPWRVVNAGSGGEAFELERPGSFDSNSDALRMGLVVVISGTARAGKLYKHLTAGAIELGTTALLFTEQTGSASGVMPDGTTPGDMWVWTGFQWALLPAGDAGEVLQISEYGLPFWGSSPAASGDCCTTYTSGLLTLNDTGGVYSDYFEHEFDILNLIPTLPDNCIVTARLVWAAWVQTGDEDDVQFDVSAYQWFQFTVNNGAVIAVQSAAWQYQVEFNGDPLVGSPNPTNQFFATSSASVIDSNLFLESLTAERGNVSTTLSSGNIRVLLQPGFTDGGTGVGPTHAKADLKIETIFDRTELAAA